MLEALGLERKMINSVALLAHPAHICYGVLLCNSLKKLNPPRIATEIALHLMAEFLKILQHNSTAEKVFVLPESL